MKDILVVEDGKIERERLERVFQQAGYSVSACSSVAEAEKCLEQHAFRLAILDIGLNDRSGSYLFNQIKRSGRVPHVMIFTGNPSVHLKQRFLEEGAIDYIVKGSPQAHNDYLLQRAREIIGEAQRVLQEGTELKSFLEQFLPQASHQLFLDADNSFPACVQCGAREYVVIFSHQPQMPPEISGLAVCGVCGKPMDPEIK